MRRRLLALGLLAALLPVAAATAPQANSRVPAGYPASYAQTIAAARNEGRLIIWSATDDQKVAELIADFRRLYPGVVVDYAELTSRVLNERFLTETRAGRATADVMWSSAMDLQIKLVNDGYAQTYVSPERAQLPEWANWKNQAWGITAEPIVFVYNKRLIGADAMPKSHGDLREWLERHAGKPNARIATYDPVNSATGYLYLAQDKQAQRNVWRLVAAMGRNGPRLFPTAEGILTDVGAGRSAIGYNVVGPYALDELDRNSNLGVVLPYDYTLVMSRIAIIPAAARHPNAARLFLDFLLSRRGQAHLVAHHMPSVRSDIPRPALLLQRPGAMRAIRVGPTLLVNQDQLTRALFMKNWSRALAKR